MSTKWMYSPSASRTTPASRVPQKCPR